jgi:hypothetical protein
MEAEVTVRRRRLIIELNKDNPIFRTALPISTSNTITELRKASDRHAPPQRRNFHTFTRYSVQAHPISPLHEALLPSVSRQKGGTG